MASPDEARRSGAVRHDGRMSRHLRRAARMSREHRAAVAFFTIMAAGTVGLGTAALARGHLADGVLAFLLAGLMAIIGALIRVNWRVLEMNRSLGEQNQRLLDGQRAVPACPPQRPWPAAEEDDGC